MSNLKRKNFTQKLQVIFLIKNHPNGTQTKKEWQIQEKFDKVIIPEINELNDQEQADKLADHFSEIPNQYDQLKTEDI